MAWTQKLTNWKTQSCVGWDPVPYENGYFNEMRRSTVKYEDCVSWLAAVMRLFAKLLWTLLVTTVSKLVVDCESICDCFNS